MGDWKYFTPEEIRGLDESLVGMLDFTRETCGFPLQITSGYRDPAHNAEIGGVPDSAHTKGLAVDLRKPIGLDQLLKMVWALGLAGFRRIEIADRHVHVDMDLGKGHPVMWFGVSK